jgi:single-strand DNA-binding protein
MATLNKVFLIGRLGRDPEVRVTPNGTKVCGFSMAVTKETEVVDGAKREITTWVELEAWGKTGEMCGQYLRKGSSCHVEGRLKLEEWTDKVTGARRSRMKVVAERVQFLDAKGGGGQGQQEQREEGHYYPGGRDESPRGQQQPAASRGFEAGRPKPGQAPAAEDLDEDVPF